jgi:hypothetical protein
MKRASAIFLIILLSGCAARNICRIDPILAEHPEGVVYPSLGREFPLQLGETGVFCDEGLFIRFKEVVADGRCPPGATCFWEGNAQIEIEASEYPGPVKALRLNTLRSPTKVRYHFYVIELVDLRPVPCYSDSETPMSCTALLLVEKGGE